MGAVLAIVYAVVLVAGWAAAQAPGAPPARATGRPWATGTAVVVVGVPSLLQLTVAPGLLARLGREPGELTDGQAWRLATSLVVQDGGWGGAVFNLVALAVVGVAAERVWGPTRWALIWLVAGVGAQFWGLVVQPHGGGNSVATFGLAASLAVVAIVRGRGPARWCGTLCLLAGVALLALRDVHGGAVVLGAATGLVLVRSTRSGATAEDRRPAAGPAPGSRP